MYTYHAAFKIVRLEVYHRPIGGIEMVGVIGLPLTNMRYRNGWVESVVLHRLRWRFLNLYKYNLYRVMFAQLDGKCIAWSNLFF